MAAEHDEHRPPVSFDEVWQRTFDALPDLIAIMDREHRIVRINRAMAERLRLSPGEAVGVHCYGVVHGTDGPPGFCPHSEMLEDGREHVAEIEELRLGGDFIVSVTPLHDEAGSLVGSVHVARDITERRRMERELEKANLELVEAAKMKAQFVDMAIHDMGSPLSVVRGYSDMMVGGHFGELTDGQRNALEAMRRSVGILAGLRGDMLEVSRFEQGRIELRKEPVDIALLVQATADELRFLLDGKQQSLSLEVPELRVDCDPRRVKQAVSNYLSNAIRYTPEQGRIAVAASRQGDEVVIAVSDNGRGLAPEDRERVFEGFYRAGERVAGSTGLGLLVVRKVAEAHGGRAWCESELGKGSTFFLAIPAAGRG